MLQSGKGHLARVVGLNQLGWPGFSGGGVAHWHHDVQMTAALAVPPPAPGRRGHRNGCCQT